ncbi:hypothetical protein FRC12_011272 [Ceratobasidium sp. 428]|nr:hypothetical protein FRC12_011272 [Ceratobasidium sp. 428]
MDHWDNNAFCNLGSLLWHKYLNALKIIETASSFIAKFPGISHLDFEHFFNKEVKYLATVKSGLPNNDFGANYVELLEQLEQKQAKFGELHTVPANDKDGDKPSDLQRELAALQLDLRRQTVLDQLLNI